MALGGIDRSGQAIEEAREPDGAGLVPELEELLVGSAMEIPLPSAGVVELRHRLVRRRHGRAGDQNPVKPVALVAVGGRKDHPDDIDVSDVTHRGEEAVGGDERVADEEGRVVGVAEEEAEEAAGGDEGDGEGGVGEREREAAPAVEEGGEGGKGVAGAVDDEPEGAVGEAGGEAEEGVGAEEGVPVLADAAAGEDGGGGERRHDPLGELVR